MLKLLLREEHQYKIPLALLPLKIKKIGMGFSARLLLFAKLNESNRATNQAFPEKDQLKALDLTWTHYLRPDIPLKLNGWISDSDVHGNDDGASIGIEFPLEKGLFSY